MNYKINKQGSHIKMRLKKGGGTTYFTYNTELEKILKAGGFSMFEERTLLKGKFNNNDKFYLHDLAIACYMGKVKAETMKEDLKAFCRWKSERGLTVDHADSNRYNNTVLNLSLMDGKLNQSKQNITERFVPPYRISSAYYDGEYRVCMSVSATQEEAQKLFESQGLPRLTEGSGEAVLWFLCPSAAEYVECLRWLYSLNYGWIEAAAPKKHRTGNEKAALSIQASMREQEALAALDRNRFNVYKGGRDLKKSDCLNFKAILSVSIIPSM